jgi:phytanoyl-CoA hydroxylase
MPDAQALLETFRRDGVVHVPGYLDSDALQQLEDNLARYIQGVVPGLPPTEAFCETTGDLATLKQLERIQQYDPYFEQVAADAQHVTLAETLLEDAVTSRGVQWFNKPARIGRPTPPHQDGFYFCLKPNEAVTMWIALDRVTHENGCLHYALGSHHDGIRPHSQSNVLGFSQGLSDFGPRDREREIVVELPPGDLVVHHSRTIHWADANESDRTRRAFALVYYAARAQRDDEAFARYLASSRNQQKSLGAV